MKNQLIMKNITAYLLAIFLFLAVFTAATAQDSDIETIKKRVVFELMKPAVDDDEVTKLIQSIKEDGTWPGIDYSNVSREGFEHRYHSGNMVKLARAYKNKSSKYYKKKKVKATINLALKNWVENDYFCDNWWHNQIGTTNSLVTLMMIVGDELA